MTDTVYQCKIYCITENAYVSGYGSALPTQCYNNNAHTVNSNSAQIINTIQSNEVTINQNNTALAGRFHIECVSMTALPNQITTYLHTFDVATSLHSFNFALNAGESGDSFSISVNPDTPLGLIAQDAKSGDTVINVSQYVIKYMFSGFYLTFTDGTNTDIAVKIISQDLVNNTITIKPGLTHNYSATNTMMLLNYYCIKDMPILLGTTYSFGGEIINASNIPAGTNALFSYNNQSPTVTKTVAVYLCGLI